MSFSEQLQEENKKFILAKKLIDGKIDVDELSDEEIQEMIKYFENSVKEKEKRLEIIKENIIKMRENK